MKAKKSDNFHLSEYLERLGKEIASADGELQACLKKITDRMVSAEMPDTKAARLKIVANLTNNPVIAVTITSHDGLIVRARGKGK